MTPQELHLSILEQAFQGRLTERGDYGGTGYDLLNRIKAEKSRLIKAKAIKKEKELPPITDDDIPQDKLPIFKALQKTILDLFKK